MRHFSTYFSPEDRNDYSVTALKYQTVRYVKYVSPGFVVSGVTRAFLMKVPCLTFQMLDVSDTTPQNISLAEDTIKCKENYPEFYIDCQGTILISVIRHTFFDKVYDIKPQNGSQNSVVFTLHTSEPYSVVKVTAKIEQHKHTVL